MTSDHISAATIYVMWREEQIWNASVLQRVHFSDLILCGYENSLSR
jgi:hypothetical protein